MGESEIQLRIELPPADVGDWHVLHTKSRQEKVVAAELGAMGIAYYLPLVRQVRYYGRRKAKVAMPLFPGYLFLRGSLEQVYGALDSDEFSFERSGTRAVASRDALEAS